MKARVLFLVTEDWYFTSHRLAFARQLVARGFEIAVACRVSDKRELIEAEGIRVFPVPFARERLSPMAVVRACVALRKVFAAYHPDLVHLVALRAILIGWLATVGQRRPPFVNAITGLGSLFSGAVLTWRLRVVRGVVSSLFRRVFSHPTASNVFQNEEDRLGFIERGLTQARCCHLIRGAGVEPETWLPRREPIGEKPVVLFVSRLLRDKGLAELVQASIILHRRGVAHELRIVGDVDRCNPMSLTEQEIAAWQVAGKLEWLGRRNDVLEQMSGANLVVLPSYREGLPKVLLEAGVAQRAVITSDVVGCREVVRDEINGLLVPPRDAQKLAAAIERLLLDGSLRSRLATENRRRIVNEFSLDKITQQFLELYAELLRGSNP